MNLNKNINMNASNCKSCESLGTVTMSPTLLTDREVTYGITGHGFVDDSCQCDPADVDDKISKAIQDAINSISGLYKRIR